MNKNELLDSIEFIEESALISLANVSVTMEEYDNKYERLKSYDPKLYEKQYKRNHPKANRAVVNDKTYGDHVRLDNGMVWCLGIDDKNSKAPEETFCITQNSLRTGIGPGQAKWKTKFAIIPDPNHEEEAYKKYPKSKENWPRTIDIEDFPTWAKNTRNIDSKRITTIMKALTDLVHWNEEEHRRTAHHAENESKSEKSEHDKMMKHKEHEKNKKEYEEYVKENNPKEYARIQDRKEKGLRKFD